MKKSDCFYLGRVTKKYSFKGEVIIKLDTDEPEIYENLNAVFIEVGKDLLPFFIEKSSFQRGRELRIRFEDVKTEQDAEAILKKEVYLPLELLPKLSGEKFYFHEVIGFSLLDVNLGAIGIIESINDSTAQALFIVSDGEDQILVPMVEDFIIKVDRKKREVLVETPEGLIEMNK
ncbi:MAG: ribosome maturation factor RimM [Lutimonas sp.]